MDKKYKTKDGNPVRILCIDKPGDYPVVGLVDSSTDIDEWTLYGKYYDDCSNSIDDLVEVSEWDDFKIDDPVMVRDSENGPWFKRYFAGVNHGKPSVWCAGATSWSSESSDDFVYWKQFRKPTAEELGKK